jgi:hypothetical protein
MSIVQIAQYQMTGWLGNDELEIIWEEIVMGYLKVHVL